MAMKQTQQLLRSRNRPSQPAAQPRRPRTQAGAKKKQKEGSREQEREQTVKAGSTKRSMAAGGRNRHQGTQRMAQGTMNVSRLQLYPA